MSWKAEYAILIMITTLVSYFSALQIARTENTCKKKFFLIFSLSVCLGFLFFFKYFNFVSESVREFLGLFSIQFNSPLLEILLPVGISFYTFQVISYTIDIYNKKVKPERHLGIFALFVVFFPQLVAGPIERAGNLLPQFFEKHYFDYKLVTDGLKIMLWGFFKKIVVADNLSIIVNTVYNNPLEYSGLPLILATFFFSFQIYCDFSGYSDIAIGAAQIMGFKLMDNFKRPYFSRSINEFWKRWHISLSSWFKDYLYIPLGGNRVSIPRRYFNLSIVFLISGLWHGANWTFVMWGALHGFCLIFEIVTKPLKIKLAGITGLIRFPRLIQLLEVSFTFLLVTTGWIFFRANSLSDAFYVLTHMFRGISFTFEGINIGVGWVELVIAFLVIIFMEFVHLIQEHRSIRQFLDDKPLLLRGGAYLTLILLITLFGVFNKTPFIYFQF